MKRERGQADEEPAMTRQKWGLHCCLFDRQCRHYAGPVWRLHINTPWWHFGAALRPSDRYVGKANLTVTWTTFRRWP